MFMMPNMVKKIITLFVYIIFNLTILIYTKNIDYFCISAAFTTIILAFLTKKFPLFIGFSFKDDKSFIVMVGTGIFLLFFVVLF